MDCGLACLPTMSRSDVTALPIKRPLDPTLLNFNEQEAQFFKSLTGIEDDEELRKHVIQVQTKAYEVRCRRIRGKQLPHHVNRFTAILVSNLFVSRRGCFLGLLSA